MADRFDRSRRPENRQRLPRHSTPRQRSHRLAIPAGCALLLIFAATAAAIDGPSPHVTVFQIAYALAAVGYALLVWSALRIATGAPAGSWKWWLVGCILLRIILITSRPGDDAYRYVWEGRIQAAGVNPYATPPDDPRLARLRDDEWHRINHPDYPAIYGPVAELEFLLAAAYPSVYTVKTLHVLWDILTIIVIAGLLQRKGIAPHLAVIYAVSPLVLTAYAIEGHVDSLMLLFLALGLSCHEQNRPNLSAIALGAAVATKAVAIVLLPWFVIRRPRLAAIALTTAVVCYIPYASAGPSLFESLVRFADTGHFFSLLGTFAITDYATASARLLAVLLLSAILLVAVHRCARLSTYATAAFTALLILMPIVHYWYVSWALLPMTLAPRIRQTTPAPTAIPTWLRWTAMSVALAAYFEASRQELLTGAWTMPAWAPLVAWAAFLTGWLAETTLRIAHWSHVPRTDHTA